MNRIRRLASIAVTAVLSLAVFFPAPAPVRAESENAGELGAVIFAFDFSRSIYCSYDGAPPTCSEIGPDLAAAVSGLADDIAANSVAYSERKVTFEVVEFGTEAFVVSAQNSTCVGNTGDPDGTSLLVACLEQIAADYLGKDSPRPELYDTFFVPPLSLVPDIEGNRCGIILFTDGKPKDPKKALNLADDLSCAVLPVSTGDPEEIDQDYLEDLAKPELQSSEGCAQSGPFLWPDVYFPTPQEAVDAIGLALDRVACPPRVPPLEKCMTLYEYEQAVVAVGLVPIRIGNASDDWYVIETNPKIGTKQVRNTPVEITSQAEPPAGCEGPPQPVAVPNLICKAPSDAEGALVELGLLWQAIGESDDPYVVSQEPTSGTNVDPGTTVIGTTGVVGEGCGCKATNPIEWLLCNLWVLLPFIGLIIARMLWIRREIEVSFNGQAAVGLGNGPWNGFEVYSGDARMNLNPRAESVQIHRSFFRSARYEDARSSGTAGLKLPLRMDEEVALADGGRFTVGYGSGGSGPEDSGEFFGGQSASRSGAGGSSESPKELEW